MSKNVVTPKSVSFEDALRNLASRLTGQPAAKLPRTQEGVVQFMAENIPTADELAEAITQEALARLDVTKLAGAIIPEALSRLNVTELAEGITQEAIARLDVTKLAEAVTQEAAARLAPAPTGGDGGSENPDKVPQEAHDAPDTSGGTSTPGEGEKPNTEAPVADDKPKRGSKTKK